jgi:hypothetical protein
MANGKNKNYIPLRKIKPIYSLKINERHSWFLALMGFCYYEM